MKKTDFEVTEMAGAFVAGQRSPGVGKKIALTEEQAEYALRAGEIIRPGQASKKTKQTKPDTPAE
jgi:hypothetical protein